MCRRGRTEARRVRLVTQRPVRDGRDFTKLGRPFARWNPLCDALDLVKSVDKFIDIHARTAGGRLPRSDPQRFQQLTRQQFAGQSHFGGILEPLSCANHHLRPSSGRRSKKRREMCNRFASNICGDRVRLKTLQACRQGSCPDCAEDSQNVKGVLVLDPFCRSFFRPLGECVQLGHE